MQPYCSRKQNRHVLLAMPVMALLFTLGVASLAVNLGGCSAITGTKAAPVNQTVTTVIADAGTVAIQAEQMYQAGQIPQTATARTAINDLGAAYNDARAAWLAVLQAESVYRATVNTQLAACAPASATGGGADACKTATAQASTAKVASDTANAALSTKISVMVSKTATVKAITTPK